MDADPSSRRHPRALTLAHVTHEAVEHIGGIGTVLEGLMTSPPYKEAVRRSILIGPTDSRMAVDPARRLGEHGKVLYSSIDAIDEAGLGPRLRPIEWAWDVKFVYGTRTYSPPGTDLSGEAEVLLIDVFNTNKQRLDVFKLRLWETFGIDSSRYEDKWDYEEYVRLAEPAFYALRSLLEDEDLPCVIFSHEFMGMPAALAAILDGGNDFRTVFHAHECATARYLVEGHPGHDTAFYSVLDRAQEEGGRYVEDIFGDLSHLLRHALVSRAHLLDAVAAVGDRTADEMRFLNEDASRRGADLVYNGVPAFEATPEVKLESNAVLRDYAQSLTGTRPDLIFTHVARPVVSKGLWRDLKLLHHLEPLLEGRDESAVLFILTSGGGVRHQRDVLRMEEEYGWPRHHREGYPDLVGPEVDIHRMIEPFNAEHRRVQVVLLNQFGFTPERIGRRCPSPESGPMDMAKFRAGADVELGMATYEPFGISPLEPLSTGAICIVSSVCGCAGFARAAAGGEGGEKGSRNLFVHPNVAVADYADLGDAASDAERDLDDLLAMTAAWREAVEERVSRDLAGELADRLPRDDEDRLALMESGQALAAKMTWDRVAEDALLPLLRRVTREKGAGV